MKTKTLLCVLLVSVIGLGTIAVFAEEELPLTTGEYPPYSSENLENYGCLTEFITAVVHEMGMKPNYKFYPWKRAEKTTQKGIFFGAFPYAINEERKKTFDFSDPIVKHKMVFFYNKKYLKTKPVWSTLKDIKSYRIGGVLGYWYAPEFEKADLKIDYTSTEETNFKKLYANRIDMYLTDEILGWWLIQKLYPNEKDLFGTLDKTYQEFDSYLMISRSYINTTQLRNKFNKALQQSLEKGILKKILVKYGIQKHD